MPSTPGRKRENAERGRSGPMPLHSALDRVADAVEAFRRGNSVAIAGIGTDTILAFAVETVSDASLSALRATAKSPALLLLTHARAPPLKIRLYTPDVVAVLPALPLRADDLRAIADPTADLASPLKGPFDTLREKLPESFAASVKLAKLAGLLPATIVRRNLRGTKTDATIATSEIFGYE